MTVRPCDVDTIRLQSGNKRASSCFLLFLGFKCCEWNFLVFTFCDDTARRRLWWRLKGFITDVLFRNFRRCFHLTNVLPTLLSDKVSCKANCGGAQAGYLGRRVLVLEKKGAKPGRREGIWKHSTSLDWMRKPWGERERKKKRKHIFGLCILAGCAKLSKIEVSITSFADFLTTKSALSSPLSSFRVPLTCCDKENDLSRFIYILWNNSIGWTGRDVFFQCGLKHRAQLDHCLNFKSYFNFS